MADFYEVSANDEGGVDISASDSDAKQVIFGWAGGDRYGMELYGRGTREGRGDAERWEWHLGARAKQMLVHGLNAELGSPKKYETTERQKRLARELLAKLKDPTLGDYDEEEMDDEEGGNEPEEGDLATSDHSHFYEVGGTGKMVLTVDEDEDMWAALNAYMKRTNFYPNVWFISDHGNAHLLERDEKFGGTIREDDLDADTKHYLQRELDRVTPDEGIIRVKFVGSGGNDTRWLNLSTAQFERVKHAVVGGRGKKFGAASTHSSGSRF